MSERLIGILPAAGMGSRLGLPYPKELLPITYSPEIITVIESALLQFSTASIHDVVVVINHDKEIIREYLGDRFEDVRLHYTYQTQKLSQEGLPDAVCAAHGHAYDTDVCVMLMADTHFTDPQVVQHLVQMAVTRPQDVATVMTWKTHEPWRFGIIEKGKDFKVAAVMDKPNHLPAPQDFWGAVAFRKGFWKYLLDEPLNFSNSLHRVSQHDSVSFLRAYGSYLDLGTPKSVIDAIIEVNKDDDYRRYPADRP